MFFVRAAFWLTIIVFLLPQAPLRSQESAPAEAAMVRAEEMPAPDAGGNAQNAATFAVASTSDLSQFCNRNVDACDSASHLAANFKDAAFEAYRNAGDWIVALVQPHTSASPAAEDA